MTVVLCICLKFSFICFGFLTCLIVNSRVQRINLVNKCSQLYEQEKGIKSIIYPLILSTKWSWKFGRSNSVGKITGFQNSSKSGLLTWHVLKASGEKICKVHHCFTWNTFFLFTQKYHLNIYNKWFNIISLKTSIHYLYFLTICGICCLAIPKQHGPQQQCRPNTGTKHRQNRDRAKNVVTSYAQIF